MVLFERFLHQPYLRPLWIVTGCGLLLTFSSCQRQSDALSSHKPELQGAGRASPGDKAGSKELSGQTSPDLREILRQLTGASLPEPSQVSAKVVGGSVNVAIGERKLLLSRAGSGETLEALLYGGDPIEPGPGIVILAGERSHYADLMLALYREAAGILVIRTSRERKISQRVQDALTAIAYLRDRPKIRSVDLVGLGADGPTCLLARGLSGEVVRRTYAEYAGFSFAWIKDPNDDRYLPEASRYGDLGGLAAAIAPGELFLGIAKGLDAAPLRKAYGESSALRIDEGMVLHSEVVKWLLR
jgi:hypothetical protein